uniref:Uncharacterized protein n=1 Tax=Chrysotila carterae TaxID=13221 RepID=A0A6S9SPG4_CHRCT
MFYFFDFAFPLTLFFPFFSFFGAPSWEARSLRKVSGITGDSNSTTISSSCWTPISSRSCSSSRIFPLKLSLCLAAGSSSNTTFWSDTTRGRPESALRTCRAAFLDAS